MQYIQEEEDFTDDDSDYEEGFTDDDSDYQEGFTDDDEEEGFLSNLFEGFKSKKPNKAERAKIRARERRKREAKRWKKRGQTISKGIKKFDKKHGISKGIKKFDKKHGISKTAKKYADRALTRAQMQAKIAKQQMEENNIALGNAQKHMAEMKSSIMKQVPDDDAKAFNKLPTPKKSASLVFLAFAVVTVLIVFALYRIKYSTDYIADIISDKTPSRSVLMSVGFIVVILAVIALFLVIFKGAVIKSDMDRKTVMGVISSVLTIGLPVIGITMLTIENLPLMMRSFENTFGFSWIRGDALKDTTQKMFGGNGNYNDYSIIATQLFEENFKYYLTCMKKDTKVEPNINLNRFKNVFIDDSYFDDNGKIKMRVPDKDKPDEKTQNLYDLLSMVVRKRHISVATWISLATIVTMYSSYLL